jgi:hypothetical protein
MQSPDVFTHSSAVATSQVDRPVTELIQQLSRDGTLLFQQELALAKRELEEKANRFAKNAIALGIGAIVLLIGALVLVAALVLLLGEVMPYWASALVIGGLVSITGVVLVMKAQDNMKHTELTPKRTVDSLRSDLHMMKEAAR